MARKNKDKSTKRAGQGMDDRYYRQGGDGQYYQGSDGSYYQQGMNGQYYQQGGGQYYQGTDGQYYQQGMDGQYYQGADGQYYQQGGGQYYQGADGQYYQQGMAGQYYQGADGQYYQQGDGQYYQQPYMGQQEAAASRKPKKRKKKRRWILFVLEVLVLIALAVVLYAATKMSKYEVTTIDETAIEQSVQEQLPEQVAAKLKGYWNIALYGIDFRAGEESKQSDTIMVASINKDTKEVKLASVYRDSYLQTTDGSFVKATDCYAIWGPERSIGMLNRNLDLDISDYVTVDMTVLCDVVEAIGGVEITVREDEVEHLNNYQNEGSMITGMEKIPVSAGTQILNGLQALSYCRIRYTDGQYIDGVYHEGLDYERAERQRTVLNKILEKVKTMDLMTINNLIDAVLPNVSTNLTMTEILSLAKDIAAYELVDTTGFPFDKQTADTDAGDCVIPVNLAANVKQLHGFLFDEGDYTSSDTVQAISDEIAYRTGIY